MATEADRSHNRTSIEHALGLWRGAAQILEWPMQPGWREDYEHAIGVALASLRACRSMADWLTAYFADELPGAPEDGDWLEAACQSIQSGRVLNRGIVEDVAFWRRARALIRGECEQ